MNSFFTLGACCYMGSSGKLQGGPTEACCCWRNRGAPSLNLLKGEPRNPSWRLLPQHWGKRKRHQGCALHLSLAHPELVISRRSGREAYGSCTAHHMSQETPTWGRNWPSFTTACHCYYSQASWVKGSTPVIWEHQDLSLNSCAVTELGDSALMQKKDFHQRSSSITLVFPRHRMVNKEAGLTDGRE